MKELWSILMEKLRQVESNVAVLGIGILALFTIGMSTIVVVDFINMIVKIVAFLSGQPIK